MGAFAVSASLLGRFIIGLVVVVLTAVAAVGTLVGYAMERVTDDPPDLGDGCQVDEYGTCWSCYTIDDPAEVA